MRATTVYKYRHAKRSIDLRSCTLRLTPPGEFNDPFEGLPAVTAAWDSDALEYMEGEMHRLAAADGVTLAPAEVAAELRGVDDLVARNGSAWVSRATNEIFGVVSFSAHWDDGLMWGHYADSHRGFVVGYDALHSWFDTRTGPNDPMNHLVPMNYSKVRPAIPLSAFLGGHTDEERATALFLTKARAWRYEREVRLVRRLDTADLREGTSHLLRYPPELVREVIVGQRMSYSDRAELLGILDDPRYRHVARFEAILDAREYRMSRREWAVS